MPENHLARFVAEIVSQLNLQPIIEAYIERGSKAHHPEVLLALLFYGYATGVYSSHKIERATYDSVAFRFIAANTHPDHDTIATFRKRFLNQLQPLFEQILIIARKMGLLKPGKVSLDDTKIKANTSKHRAMSWKYACKLEKQLKAEVNELLRLAEKADNEDLSDGMNITEELSRRQDRLASIASAKERIEKRAAERYAHVKKAYDAKTQARHDKARETGKKPRGRGPKPPESGPRSKDPVNFTDEQFRIMPTFGKGVEQAYNAQVSVDIDSMLIVESHVSQSTNDKQELVPSLKGLSSLPKKVGKVDGLFADAGYFSEDNVTACELSNIEPMISPRARDSQPTASRTILPARNTLS